MGVSYRCADLRFDAQRTTKHQSDGCPIFTTIFDVDVTLIVSEMFEFIKLFTDYIKYFLC